MTNASLYDYLERLCNLLRVQSRAAGAGLGLQPVQLQALRFLSACNRFSDHPQAVADYLGQTKGTVSQTIGVLEQKGLLTKLPDNKDRRVMHLRITEGGRRALARTSPSVALMGAAAALSPSDRASLEGALGSLLRAMQQENGLRTFGPCITCRFNRETTVGRLCGLTGELLAEDDLGAICREHEYPQPS
jgi:DNA-binding MarR family transcriptional regulator